VNGYLLRSPIAQESEHERGYVIWPLWHGHFDQIVARRTARIRNSKGGTMSGRHDED